MAETIRIEIRDLDKPNNERKISGTTLTKYEKSAARSEEMASGMIGQNLIGIDSIIQRLYKESIALADRWTKSLNDIGTYTGDKCEKIERQASSFFDRIVSKIEEMFECIEKISLYSGRSQNKSNSSPRRNITSGFVPPVQKEMLCPISPSVENNPGIINPFFSELGNGLVERGIDKIAEYVYDVFEKMALPKLDGSKILDFNKEARKKRGLPISDDLEGYDLINKETDDRKNILGSVSTLLAIEGAMSALGGAADMISGAVSQKDKVAGGKAIRDGAVKVGAVGIGTGIGALIGSAIPGAGTLIGAKLGAGIGGLIAEFAGEGISDALGKLTNARDYQQKVLFRIGDDLKNAMAEYSQTINKADYAKGLISDYKKIEGLIEGGTLDFRQLEEAQEKLEGISKKLNELFPEASRAHNNAAGHQVDFIESIEGEIAGMGDDERKALGISVLEYEDRMKYGDALGEYSRLKQEAEESKQNFNNEFAFNEELRKIVADVEKYRKEYFEKPPEERDSLDSLKKYKDEAYKEIVELGERYGIDRYKIGSDIERPDGTIDAFDGMDNVFADLRSNVLIESLKQSKEDKENSEKKFLSVEEGLNDSYNSKVMLSGVGQIISDFNNLSDVLNQIINPVNGDIDPNLLTEEMVSMVQSIIPSFSSEMSSDEIQGMLQGELNRLEIDSQEAMGEIIKINMELEKVGARTIQIPIAFVTRYNNNHKDPYLSLAPVGEGIVNAGMRAAAPYAQGGILSTPHLGLVAEDGPESIIPLSGKRRSRGIDLWKRTGELLGISQDESKVSFAPIRTSTSKDQGSDTKVNLTINPTINIKGNDPEHIAEQVKFQIMGMVDDITNKIADNLEVTFSNMPMNA